MFHGIGTRDDVEAARRRAVSIAITAGVVGLIGGAIALQGLFTLAAPIAPARVDAPMVMAIEVEEPVPDEAPAAPPAARYAPRETIATPVPVDPPASAPTLTPIVDQPLVSDASGGTPDGRIDGDHDGKLRGTPGGTGDVDAASGTGSAYKTFYHSDLQWKSRIAPEYPDAARSLGLGDVACRVEVRIDASGVPEGVDFQACPMVFHAAVRQAVMTSRWYPAKAGGEKVKARFLLIYQFKLT